MHETPEPTDNPSADVADTSEASDRDHGPTDSEDHQSSICRREESAAVVDRQLRVETLEGKVAALEQERESLRSRVSSLEGELETLETELDTLQDALQHKEEQRQQTIDRYERLLAAKEQAYRDQREQATELSPGTLRLKRKVVRPLISAPLRFARVGARRLRAIAERILRK